MHARTIVWLHFPKVRSKVQLILMSFRLCQNFISCPFAILIRSWLKIKVLRFSAGLPQLVSKADTYVCAWFAAATTGTFKENDFPNPEGRKNRNLIKFLAGATAEGKTYQFVNGVEVGHSSCPDALM